MTTRIFKCSNCGYEIKKGRFWDIIPVDCPVCDAGFMEPIDMATKSETVSTSVTESPTIGIGGIGIFTDNEMPTIPSIAAIVRYEKAVSSARVCRRCGQSELDGAMFTTIRGGNVCDDCI